MRKCLLRVPAAVIAGLFLFLPALARADQPQLWEKWYQDPATPFASRAFGLHHGMIYVITAITLFVLALLIIVAVRFNARVNPTPRQFTHNVLLEVVWTVIPVIILIVIVVPSVRLIYYGDRTAEPEMTLKVTGYQWYWGYEYPDFGEVSFLANRIPDNEIDKGKGQVRLLSTDNPVVVPVDTNIQVLVTAADVLHSWAVPSFGVKMDGEPGRINETWMRITRPGVYYGQCSELCGANHAFMPIEIRAVPKEEFRNWIVAQGGTLPAPAAAQPGALPSGAAPAAAPAPGAGPAGTTERGSE